MPDRNPHHLSRRERQIMDIIYARGEAAAAEVHEALPDAPSYSAVRTLLRILEEKGHLKHREDGPRYVFMPTEPLAKASRSALKRVVQTFFDGSLSNAVAALVDGEGGKLSAEELQRIEAIIKSAKARSKQ
jgi:BlaI family transcriptional regulator, penicillinase repressor